LAARRWNTTKDKVDDKVLALLNLTLFEQGSALRAWKGHDWEALDLLHGKGCISDPKSKAKSVVMTEEGARRFRDLFERYFAKEGPNRRQR
jgi:hypothetical protein